MSNDITEVNSLRNFVREIYLESFHSAKEHRSIHSESGNSEKEAKSRIHAFFDEQFIEKNKKNEDIIKFDSRYENQNPLFDIWKMYHFKYSFMTRDFAIFDLLSLERYKNGITEYDLKFDDAGKNELFSYTGKSISHTQLSPYLKDLLKNGILSDEIVYNNKKDKDKTLFKLKNTKSLQNLIGNTPEIIKAIKFASEIFPCGVIGSYILDSVNKSDYQSPIYFKHNFIFRTLDSEILYTLLSAIHEKRFVKIEEENRIFNVVPIQLRYSSYTGRNYLIYYTYDQKRKGFNSENCEKIISVNKANNCLCFEELKKQYEEFEKYIWGKAIPTSSKGKQPELIEFNIVFEKNEKYILKRIQRESFTGNITENENIVNYSLYTYQSNELLPWLRSYFGRITKFKFERNDFQEQILSDIKKLYSLYNYLPNENIISRIPKEDAYLPQKKRKLIPDSETDFFNRIYSSYYRIALIAIKKINSNEILTEKEFMNFLSSFRILHGKTAKKTNEYINAFLESTVDLFKVKNGNIFTPIKNITDDFLFPLTTIEISFLKVMLNDERCKLFLGNTYELLKTELDKKEYEDVYPYFSKESYKVFDKYLNGDDIFFQDNNYIHNFILILSAIDNKTPLKFEYAEDNIIKSKISIPEKIEYSEKENRFKVVLNCKNRPLDIQNILTCKNTKSELSTEKNKETLTCIVIADIPKEKKHTLNRFFREFSTFERDCEKITDERYKLSFKFEKGDYKEIVIRLLQFGPYVYCVEPDCVREEIKKKVNRQYELILNNSDNYCH